MRRSRHLRSMSGFAVILAIAGCSQAAYRTSMPDPVASVAAQPSEILTEPPAPLPLEPIEFPPFYERTLANGARVIVVPNHEQPVVSVSLTVRGGSAADPEGMPGVAAFTADLLTKGTTTRDAKQIAEEIDFVGGQLSVTAGDDGTTIQTTVLTDFFDTALALLTDVMTHPTFPAVELENTSRQMMSALQAASGQPDLLAERRFRQEVYGAHPYGHTTTPASIAAIARSDVVAFYERFYRPSQALIIVTGDIEPASIVARLDRALAEWTAGDSPTQRATTPPLSPAPAKRRLIMVHKPGSVQAVYRIGHLLPPASNPDWVEIGVMRVILGGSAGRLTRVLREQKGYAYAAYAMTQEQERAGSLMMRTEVRTEVADSALAEILRLFEEFHSGSVQADELAGAKSALTGGFPMTIETPQQVGDQVMTTLLLGRSVDYLTAFRTRVAAMTVADLKRVAHEYLHPEHLVIVVVGDATQLLEKLRPFADVVELYDVNGRPLAAQSLVTSQPR